MEQLEAYIEKFGIEFKLSAVNVDGDVILEETSTISFGDVADFATLLDERFEKLVISDLEHEESMLANDRIDEDRSF